MSDHSPEPWAARKHPSDLAFDGYYRIVDADGRHVATVPCSTQWGEQVGVGTPNRERILACVNACAGHSTADLEKAARGEVLAVLGTPRELMDALQNAPDGTVVEMTRRCCCGALTTVHTTLEEP